KKVLAAQDRRSSGGGDSGGAGRGPSCRTGSSHSGLLDKWRIDDKLVKIGKWDGSAVKTFLDDSFKKILLENVKPSRNLCLV
uniref:Microsomal signal peptidase 25 kDa subunit n=1 Tax=Prolemur simus TaxID=1328070 RepID=A0A8C8YSD7_PROSS